MQCSNPGWSVVRRYPGLPPESTIQVLGTTINSVSRNEYKYYSGNSSGFINYGEAGGGTYYTEPPLLGAYALIARKNGVVCGYANFNTFPVITHVCLDKNSYPTRATICAPIAQCPPNTCSVDCGSYVCCYGADGISVFNYNK
ncbi:MAG: hypothetical protein ACRDBG_24020 [Waterburya sp.]